jgi:uncharacterized protein with PQ loop repeat
MSRDILGIIASFLTVCSLFPQVLKVYQTQRTRDLSLGRYSMIFTGTSLWAVYFWENNWLAFANETICAVLYSYILSMKLTENERES